VKCDITQLLGLCLTQEEAEELGENGWVIHYKKFSREFEWCSYVDLSVPGLRTMLEARL
jgi:hypothetical protein